MWRAPSDPDQLDEAIAWLRQRVPVTAKEYEDLSTAARAQAFTIGGTQQLHVVQSVLDEIARSVEQGEDVEAFRTRIEKVLGEKFVDKNSARLTAAYRTTAQTAYATGRWDELEDPALKRKRPYRIFDAILDQRTTVLCRSLDATVLPADDPWWLTHWPPLHFNCRSSVRALTAKQAMAYSGQWPPKKVKVDEGFGLAPPKRERWEPDPKDFSPKAWAQYKRKQKLLEDKTKPGRKKPAPKPKPVAPASKKPHAAVSKVHAGFRKLEQDGGKASRRAMDAFLSEEVGLYKPKPLAGSDKLVLKPALAGKSRGLHYHDDNIEIRQAVFTEATAGLARRQATKHQFVAPPRRGVPADAPAEAKAWAQYHQHDAIKTVLHESIHGTGSSSNRSYANEGHLLEEVVTEVTARYASRTLLAYTPPADSDAFMPDPLAMPHPDTWHRNVTRMYDPYIGPVMTAIRDHTGWKPEKVASVLEQAAISYKQTAAQLDKPSDASAHFIAQLEKHGGKISAKARQKLHADFTRHGRDAQALMDEDMGKPAKK